MTAWAVHSGARLGTASAPFLGRYRFQLAPSSVLAPAVAVAVLSLQAGGWFERARWGLVSATGYLAGLAWALGLVLVDGEAGLTRPLRDPDNFLSEIGAVRNAPLHYLQHFTQNTAIHSVAARGHPPGPVLLLWALDRAGLHSVLGLALLITAVGTLTVPLVLSAVRGVCGETQARRYATVLILAPYAIWVAVSTDVFTAALGAAMVAAGVRASDRRRTGPPAGAWALVSGALLGLASLFSYSAPWLGLSVVCLYFARRRPFLNIGTGLGALLPVLVADRLGFPWLAGLAVARADYASRIEPFRPVLWWSVISMVALLLACGPALVASMRKMRNTPGWPFLVGAGCAVAFSVLAGLARGGVEHAWLAFFPWLTVAAVAPRRQAGPDLPAPVILAASGAVAAMVIEAVLATL
ncbi:membrane protein [Rugosimonospora acidiphila]|uniref:Membrane protein n=1 Tax=Rugosimonospora acidiphila TaxID=556531 RepID=A0ABP9S7Y1_9ACTN